MKIAQSNVNLVSNRTYYEENTVTIQSGVVTRGSFMDSLLDQEKKLDSVDITESGQGNLPLGSENYTSLKPSKSDYLSSVESSLEEQISNLRTTLLERILRLLQLLDTGGSKRGYQGALENTANMLSGGSFVRTTTVTAVHMEEESTTFNGSGTAVTEDGRVIDFGVQFSMSRRLCEYAGISTSSSVNLIDPLVINVDSGVTHISDQSFYFDLDCDGVEEKISNLGAGSGFLAYDRNGDGRIGDGSELFGTKSGNGFEDLRGYDSDGNGWIDESDEIYDHLQVWLRGEDGTDTLLSLKEADVGAIYLGSAETQFSHFGGFGGGFGGVNGLGGFGGSGLGDAGAGATDFRVTGVTRSSGIFLKESGGVGTVQQVDLAAL
ncbi:MAG: hypothetical protein E7307_04875 [Butyrivibrio sp.]|nr:hypothetical protein [Butyrivibrio sp.]